MAPNSFYYIELNLKQWESLVPKGTMKTLPAFVYLKNEKAKEFVMTSALFCVWVWESDKLMIHTQTSDIKPKHQLRGGF